MSSLFLYAFNVEIKTIQQKSSQPYQSRFNEPSTRKFFLQFFLSRGSLFFYYFSDVFFKFSLKTLKKILIFPQRNQGGDTARSFKIGNSFNSLDGSTGEKLALSTKMCLKAVEIVEVFDRCVKFLTHRCRNGPNLLLVQS